MTDINESKLLVCPKCDHNFYYEEWQTEEACPLCKHKDGWDIEIRDGIKSRKVSQK